MSSRRAPEEPWGARRPRRRCLRLSVSIVGVVTDGIRPRRSSGVVGQSAESVGGDQPRASKRFCRQSTSQFQYSRSGRPSCGQLSPSRDGCAIGQGKQGPQPDRQQSEARELPPEKLGEQAKAKMERTVRGTADILPCGLSPFKAYKVEKTTSSGWSEMEGKLVGETST